MRPSLNKKLGLHYNNNVLLSESLGVMDMFEKYLESFEDLSDQKKIDLIEFGKEIITEYESENE